MQYLFASPVGLCALSLLLSAALTYAVRELAIRRGLVAKPKDDRWHKRETAMMGGVAIFVATLVSYAAFVPPSVETIVIVGASSFLFLVGLLDDFLNIKPYQKLIGQMIGATIVIGFGMRLPLTGYELVDLWITLFWLIGITNAINLLDNMDGLAAGIAAIAAASIGVTFAFNGHPEGLLLASVFVGALLGFLIFNFNPASIFMGDSGSMFVGFLLASSVLIDQSGGRSRGVLSILAVPVLILFVPIFDTTFVTVIRKMWGRKASQGGRDHTSHRLVALGLSERRAVLMIYAFAATAGLLSLLVSRLETTLSLALIGLFTAALTIIGVYLSKVKVYSDRDEVLVKPDNAVFAFLIDISYKRRIFEVFLDAFLITLAYYTSYVMMFGTFEENPGNWELFIKSAPLLVVLKLFAYLIAGVYRGIWRYTSVADLITFVQGVMIGSALSVFAILLLYRFENFSRAVFILDGLILLLLLVSSRIAFRVIRQLLPHGAPRDGRRVLIYGAGDGGEMVLRELRNNPAWAYRPVGFIDDDPLKKGKVINGLRVYDANGSLADICHQRSVAEILISSSKISEKALARIREVCRQQEIDLKRAEMRIERIDLE